MGAAGGGGDGTTSSPLDASHSTRAVAHAVPTRSVGRLQL